MMEVSDANAEDGRYTEMPHLFIIEIDRKGAKGEKQTGGN